MLSSKKIASQARDYSPLQAPSNANQAESDQADKNASVSERGSGQPLRPLHQFHAARAPARVAGALLSAGRMPLQVCDLTPFQVMEALRIDLLQKGF